MDIKEQGLLTVYCGPMFAKKTSALIAEIQCVQEMEPEKTIKVFKPCIDKRYDVVDIKTHDGDSLQELTGLSVTPVDIDFDFSSVDADMIFVDEIQFFDKSIVVSFLDLIKRGISVSVCGLDLDSRGMPFGPMPELLCVAGYVQKLEANCSCCQNPATRTFRKVKSSGQVLVGGNDMYEARCLIHWSPN